MSSIFGKCNTDKVPVAPGDLELMQDELNHWNADDVNVWIHEAVGLGHLMLYNTPQSLDEKMPLHDSLCRLSVTADARIDNRDEIYQLLQIKTPEEKSLPDSSIILLLYKKYGADCVKYLIGDFAFAIWDENEQRLFCARDQMGVKPFFYCKRDNVFAFASEKKGLLCLPGFDKAIDRQFFYNQVFWPRIQAADTTLYKNIRRLEPANTLTFYPLKNQLQLNQYWTLDAFTETKLQRKEDYYDGLRHHFEAAVICRLRSHYPVGAELSGGMDSSAITGVASHFVKRGGSNIITFSNVDNGDEPANKGLPLESERQYAEAVVKFNSITDCVFVKEDIWDNPLDEIDFALKVNDGLEMWNLLWLAPIKKAAMGKNVRSLLSGFPGDEMVTYRGQFYFLDYLDRKQYLKYFSAKGERAFNKLKPFMPPGLEFSLHKLKNIVTSNKREIKDVSDFFKIPASGRVTKGDVVWKDNSYPERFKSYRHFQKYRLLKPQVPLRMEAETRFGMPFKVEPRFPMADIRLTQFYISMPDSIKHEGTLSRSAFRTAIQKYVPDAVLQRDNKTGSTALFRLTQKVLTRQQENSISIMDKIGNSDTNNKIITADWFGRIPSQIAFLELLRWYEKNLGL